MMEKIEGVPEIVRFKNILDDACIKWISNRGKIVFCMHGWIFEVMYWDDANILTLSMFSEFMSVTNVNKPFTASSILPYIYEKFGND